MEHGAHTRFGGQPQTCERRALPFRTSPSRALSSFSMRVPSACPAASRGWGSSTADYDSRAVTTRHCIYEKLSSSTSKTSPSPGSILLTCASNSVSCGLRGLGRGV